MADIGYAEDALLRGFVPPERAQRYRELLKGRKKRPRFLDELNHNFAYRPELAERLPGNLSSPAALLAFLRSEYVNPTCVHIADGTEWDGRELRIERAVEALLGNHFGGLLVCPPKPIVVYKPESPTRLVVLRPDT